MSKLPPGLHTCTPDEIVPEAVREFLRWDFCHDAVARLIKREKPDLTLPGDRELIRQLAFIRVQQGAAHVMPFGKHKGRLLEEIDIDDPSYLDWLVEQDWFRTEFPALHEVVANFDADGDGDDVQQGKALTPEPPPLEVRTPDGMSDDAPTTIPRNELGQPDLQALIERAGRRHAAAISEEYIEDQFKRPPHQGGCQHITPEEWAAWDRANEEYQARLRDGLPKVDAKPATADLTKLPHPQDMTLEQIQAELRAVSRTLPRFEGDATRRQLLWRRLDTLATNKQTEEGSLPVRSGGVR